MRPAAPRLSRRLAPLLGPALALAVAGLGGCDPFSPNLGDRPFRCASDEPACPDGYQCVEYSASERVCERETGVPPDASPDGDSYACNDDGMLEPNDATNTAWTTPIPPQDSIPLVSLAICPAGDVDLYRFGTENANRNMRATVCARLADGTLEVSVLNNAGNTIARGTTLSGEEVAVAVNNLPQGSYYVRVAGADDTVRNNYTLRIDVCDGTPCERRACQ